MTLRALILLCALPVLLWAAPVHAQSCVATTAPAIGFGTVTNPTAQKDVTGSLQLTCTGTAGTSAKACIYLGPGQDGSISPRRLTLNTASLNFQIYTTTAYAQYLGAGNNEAYETPAFTFSSSGSASVTVPLYGRVFAGQSGLTAGQYSTTMSGTIVTDPNTNRSCNSGGGNSRSYQLTATARVDASCQITADDLAFPPASRLDAPILGMSNLRVRCTNNLPYAIKLNGGMTGNANDRQMSLGGAGPGVIRYELHQDAARSQTWGDTVSTQVNGTGTGTDRDVTVYGRIPMQATPRAGAYRDTITATVEY